MPDWSATGTTSVMFRLQDLPTLSGELPKAALETPDEFDLSRMELGTFNAPDPAPAPWLAAVERRIEKSLLPSEHASDNDGRWLSRDVVNSAMTYFRNISDLLPAEPYLYSAGSGNLIAEFRAARGQLVAIVSDNVVQIVTVLNGNPSAQQPETVWPENLGSLREEVKKQVELISKGWHGGKVDP